MRISKSAYLQGFIATTITLALVRCVFPSVAGNMDEKSAITSKQTSIDSTNKDSVANELIDNQANSFVAHSVKSRFFASDVLLQRIKYGVYQDFRTHSLTKMTFSWFLHKNGE